MIKLMDKYIFVIFHNDVNNFLNSVGELGVVDISRSTKPADSHSKELFEDIASLNSSIKKLEQIKKENESNYKDSEVQSLTNEQFEGKDAKEIIAFLKENLNKKATLSKELIECQRDIENALPWEGFSLEQMKKITDLGYNFHFYIADKKKFDDSIFSKWPTQIINEINGKIYFVIVEEKGKKIDVNYKEIVPPAFPALTFESRKSQIQDELIECDRSIYSLTKCLNILKKEQDLLKSKADLYLASKASQKSAEDTLDIFTAFSPIENSEKIENFLAQQSGVYYIKERATKDDNPPIELKNNWFTRMFSVLTDMYGRPKYNEFDPTPYISIFFMLFFAMCMGDAGYGILLIIIGFLLKKASGAAKFAPLVITLGIATTIIGFIFHTFFGIDIYAASWVPDSLKKFMVTGKIAGYDAQMVIALAIGVVHICVAMLLKAIYAIKINGFKNSLGTCGWTLLIVGGVIVGAIALAGIIDKGITKIVIIVLGVLSAIGIFLLNDIHRNPLSNIGAGLWETYNTVTGLLGDVLSYIRLYALGLAGGMLGAAFNQLGNMAFEGLSVPGVNYIVLIIILVFGHVLNLSMCCLGAFVHPLRLNFLEFFKNSGYEGSGKNFNPLTLNSNN